MRNFWPLWSARAALTIAQERCKVRRVYYNNAEGLSDTVNYLSAVREKNISGLYIARARILTGDTSVFRVKTLMM